MNSLRFVKYSPRPLPSDGDGIEPLTPGHFLIGKPLESLPDPSASFHPLSFGTFARTCYIVSGRDGQRPHVSVG